MMKLKASSGETQAKKVLGYWKLRTFLAFCVCTKMTLYDIRSQEHAWLLSFLSVEKETSLTDGSEEKKVASFINQSEKSTSIFRPIREKHRNNNKQLRRGLVLARLARHLAGKALDFSLYVVIFANILALITGISTLICMTND